MTTYSLREAAPWAFDKYIHHLADPIRVAALLASGHDEDTAYAKVLIGMSKEIAGFNGKVLDEKIKAYQLLRTKVTHLP